MTITELDYVPSIGLDIDGTIRDIYTPLIKMYHLRYPGQWVKPIPFWDWDVEKNFEIGSEIRDFWFGEAAPFCYYYFAELYEPASEILALTKDFRVKFVTSAPEQTLPYTEEWLRRNGLACIEFHHTEYKKKHLIPCDIYIDDSPKEIAALLAAGRNPIFMSRPWNMEFPGNRIEKLSDVRLYLNR
jgi:5'(3')-deoxyribonucleotidase